MKRILILIALASSSSAFAADPASQFLQNTLAQGQAAFSNKSVGGRNGTLCQLVNADGDLSAIGPALLGDYAQGSDQAGINLFYQQMPSMAVTKIVENFNKAAGSQITIDDNATDNGDGTFSIGATVVYNGSTYQGTVIVSQVSSSQFQILDIQYLGFSGIDYLGGQIQQQIGNDSSSTPVHDWVKTQMADTSYVTCQ